MAIKKKDEGFLTRSGLRDAVLLLCAASAFFYPLTVVETGVALLLLVLGELHALHYQRRADKEPGRFAGRVFTG